MGKQIYDSEKNIFTIFLILLIAITSSISSVFQSELLTDEKILWAGQPETKVILRSGDILLIPFSILWCGLISIWMIGIINSPNPSLSEVLFCIPFVLIGVYLLFGRFIYENYKKKRTYYAVTNQRVLIITNIFTRKVQAKLISQIPILDKKVRRDGIGTITFDNPQYRMTGQGYGQLDEFGNSQYRGQSYVRIEAPGFYDIKDADSVYQLINELQASR